MLSTENNALPKNRTCCTSVPAAHESSELNANTAEQLGGDGDDQETFGNCICTNTKCFLMLAI